MKKKKDIGGDFWTINENWYVALPDPEIAWSILQIFPQKDVSSAGESIFKFYLRNFLHKTEFLWKPDCWLELRRSRILECSVRRNSTESNRHSQKRSLYFIFSPQAGTDWLGLGLPQVEVSPLVFDYYNIAPESVRIKNTGKDREQDNEWRHQCI